jgi:hypothetical protein
VAESTQPSDGLKPPTGVHLRRPSLVEYLLLQHPFWHSLLVEQSCQSPLREVGLGGGGVGLGGGGEGVGAGGVADPTQPSEGLNPPTGVHLRRPSLVEYLLLQHWFLH